MARRGGGANGPEGPRPRAGVAAICCEWEFQLDAVDRSKPRGARQSHGQLWAEGGQGAGARQPKSKPRS